MYTIQIKEVRFGEISFETIEEAKQWYEDREGDVFWYHDDERCNLEKAMDDDGLGSVVTVEDISKEVDWL